MSDIEILWHLTRPRLKIWTLVPVSLPSEEESRRRRQAGEEEGEVLFLFFCSSSWCFLLYWAAQTCFILQSTAAVFFFIVLTILMSLTIEQLRGTQRLLSGAARRPFPRTRVRGLASSEGEQHFFCKCFDAKNKVNILTHKSFSINICPSLMLTNLEQPTISKSITFYCSAVHLGKEECEESQSWDCLS